MIKMAFAGDLCLSSIKHTSDDVIAQGYKNIADLFMPYDVSVCNLECSYALTAEPAISMNIPIANSPSLQLLGVDVFCLANNHVKDSGAEAVKEMQDFIKQCDCLYVGAGANADEADAMLLLEKDGITMGILNVTDASHYGAGAAEPGVSVLNRKTLLARAKASSTLVDALIVIIHADLEFTNYPSPWRVRLSRELAQYCKIIIHHHSHTLQGIEEYNGCVIAYSLGNFVFPVHRSTYMKNRIGHVDEGMVLGLSINKEKGNTQAKIDQMVPTRISTQGFLRDVTPIEKAETLHNIKTYSAALNDSSFLRRHHFSLCKDQFKKFLLGIYYTYSKHGFKKALGYIKIHFSTDQHRNWMKSFFTLGYY